MKQSQGITELLKTENALEWVGQLNNIRACAVEIVEKGIVFATLSIGKFIFFLHIFLHYGIL